MEELFRDRKYCAKELGEASRMIKAHNLTFEQGQKLADALAFMYLYCDDDLKPLVLDYMGKAQTVGLANLFSVAR